MVATQTSLAAPITPTTPVRSSRGATQTIKAIRPSSEQCVPVFRPPIPPVRKQSSVRFDLREKNAASVSAFVAVSDRQKEPNIASTNIVANWVPSSKRTSSSYDGPVDVDEVSPSSTLSGEGERGFKEGVWNEDGEEQFSWLPMTPLGSEMSKKSVEASSEITDEEKVELDMPAIPRQQGLITSQTLSGLTLDSALDFPPTPPLSPLHLEEEDDNHDKREAFQDMYRTSPPLTTTQLVASGRSIAIEHLSQLQMLSYTATRHSGLPKATGVKIPSPTSTLTTPLDIRMTKQVTTRSTNSWPQTETEPFPTQQQMQEDPILQPLSCSSWAHDSGDNRVLSPPTLPRLQADLGKALLEELQLKQTHRTRTSSKRHQLENAQQVVKTILKGAKFPRDKDLTTPYACFHAIQHYALLRLEIHKLANQLETSKEQLKTLYVEWKELTDSVTETKSNAPGGCEKSVARLEEFLSDDESIYKEDGSMYSLCQELSSSLSNLESEADPAMVINAIYQQLQSQMERIRGAWKNKAAGIKIQNDTNAEDSARTTGSNRSRNNTEDSSLWMDKIKIEEETVPLEAHGEGKQERQEQAYLQSKVMEKARAILVQSVGQPSTEQTGKSKNGSVGQTEKKEKESGWTTFSNGFPYDATNRIFKSTKVLAISEQTKETSSVEDNKSRACPSETLELNLRPGCMLLRAKRFNKSYDSDHYSPLLSRNHALSLKESDEDDSYVSSTEERLLPSQKEASDDAHDREITLDRQSVSNSTTLNGSASRRKNNKFFNKISKKRRDDVDEIALLHEAKKDGPMSEKMTEVVKEEEQEEEEQDGTHLLADPYNYFSSMVESRSPALDGEVQTKLQLPLLLTEPSLPYKATAFSDETEVFSEVNQRKAGYVWLSSRPMQKEQELNKTRCQMKLVESKVKHAELELQRKERGTKKWKDMPEAKNMYKPCSIQECQIEKDRNHEIKKGLSDLNSEVRTTNNNFRKSDRGFWDGPSQECELVKEKAKEFTEALSDQKEKARELGAQLTFSTSNGLWEASEEHNWLNLVAGEQIRFHQLQKDGMITKRLKRIPGMREQEFVGLEEKKRGSFRKKLLKMKLPQKSLIKSRDYKVLKPSEGERKSFIGSKANHANERTRPKAETIAFHSISGSESKDDRVEMPCNSHSSISADVVNQDKDVIGRTSSSDSDNATIPEFLHYNTSMDANAREDAQIATIHGLMEKVARLEAEKLKLLSKLEEKANVIM